MPRYPRKLSSCNTYHVMLRGNEKKEIFYDDEDRNRFLYTLVRMKGDANFYVYAYCLMNNHVHLLIKEGNDNISRIMKRIGVSYVQYFNKKYERIGHLFQDRFRSEIIENDTYLLAAARYIHNNPVKAGLVKKAEEFRWSSYRAYVFRNSAMPNLISTDFLLFMFSDNKITAIKEFIKFTHENKEDDFIDLDIYEADKHLLIDNPELRSKVSEILIKHGQSIDGLKTCKNKKERDALLREIKENVCISIRQLSKVLGISKDIIFRA